MSDANLLFFLLIIGKKCIFKTPHQSIKKKKEIPVKCFKTILTLRSNENIKKLNATSSGHLMKEEDWNIRAFIVDKDFTEIASVEKVQ